MHNNPEDNKPKPGIIDQFIEKFERLQGNDFCYGIRTFTVDVKGVEPVIRHLVLETAGWGYETARSPEALEQIVSKLNGEKTAPSLAQLKILSRKVAQAVRYPVQNKGYLSTEGYIQSRKAALFMALCLHMDGCKIPHKCAWNEILKDVNPPPVTTSPA